MKIRGKNKSNKLSSKKSKEKPIKEKRSRKTRASKNIGFNNLSIKMKLLIAFLSISLLLVIIGNLGVSNMKSMYNSTDEMYSYNLQSIDELHMLKGNLLETKAGIIEIVNTEDNTKIDTIAAAIEEYLEKNEPLIESYESKGLSEEAKEIFDIFLANLHLYKTEVKKLVGFVKSNNEMSKNVTFNSVTSIRDSMFNHLDELIKFNQEIAETTNTNNFNAYTKTSYVMYTIILGGFSIAIIAGLFISSYIGKVIKKGVVFAEALGNGDLTYEIDVASKDELGKLVQSLKEAQSKMRATIMKIAEGSEEVSASSEELSATVEEVTSSYETIANNTTNIIDEIQGVNSSIEELTAIIEEVNSGVAQLSSNSAEGKTESAKIKEKAEKIKVQGQDSKEIADKLLAEKEKAIISAIEEGQVVNQISVIAESISSIASQTNLLALNAAIEAARAGESGRGFAVVADEIRKLAEESESYVSKIQSVVGNVESAFKNLSANSNDILDFINNRVSKDYELLLSTGVNYEQDARFVDNLSQELSAMGQELNASTEEISTTVVSIANNVNEASLNSDEILTGMKETMQALEQIAAASESQASIAERLNSLIHIFKI